MGLYVAQSGPADGHPVVFLHGAAAQGGLMWRRQTRDLTKDLRCHVVDLPGHGGSSTVPWVSLDDTADLVADVIRDNVAGGRAGLVGLSVGGYVVVRLVMRHPELVASAVASGISLLPTPFGTRMWQRGQLIARYSALGSLVSAGSRSSGDGGDTDADVDTGQPTARPVPRQALMKIADEMVNFQLPDGRKRFDGALLAIAGEHENRTVLKSLRLLAERFTEGQAKYAPECGHNWNVENPELFNATVRSWVIDRRLPPKLRDPEQWTE